MTQNIYDDASFFENYSQLPRSVHGLAGAPEWGSLQELLPRIRGLDVLDLGCGYGWFCRWAAEQGARGVLGVDVSEQMLARARVMTQQAVIRYERADLERFTPPAGFGLAYSSLAFHYLVDLGGLLKRVHDALVPGGMLVCSVEHPMVTAPRHQGWSEDESGLPTWPVGGYLDEGPRSTDWLAKGVIKQHRTIETYLALLSRAGFTLTCLREWGPSPEQVATNPDWAKERNRPPFLLLSCRRA
ncbi:class I SAM-dependent methyltransferase [Bosea sp. BK604]|uniref:class I SAM-dependent methyltransferase n=1 Tax=Bosea sp. BK604 TaxID=2512180 RepID=UPI0010472B4A|nr:class I SAM-dependent methyltransferase [Bosea sp. BK604]TCR59361.1 pimeloyl-CoA biosynthesis protein BioC [Bosea sp. BK604]